MGFKKYLTIFFLFILVIVILILTSKGLFITGKAVVSEYTLIKAICDENNFCQDYEIRCFNENVLSKTPIIGSEVQYNENWQDPRSREEREKLCD